MATRCVPEVLNSRRGPGLALLPVVERSFSGGVAAVELTKMLSICGSAGIGIGMARQGAIDDHGLLCLVIEDQGLTLGLR